MSDKKPADTNSGKKVAVICIHGVADQTRFQTAEHFAKGIADYNDEGKVDSGQMTIEDIRIQNHLKCFDGEKSVHGQKYDLYDADDIVKKSKLYCEDAETEEELIDAASEVNTYFTAKKLERFEPNEDDRIYETRVVKTRVSDQETDFYEVHWADLSRVQNSSLQLLTSFYRLIFILCRLCNNVRDFGRHNFDRMGPIAGRVFRFLNLSCTTLLASVIPALNLGMLAVFVSLAPYSMGLSESTTILNIISAFVGAVAFFVTIYWTFSLRRSPTFDWRKSIKSRISLWTIWIGAVAFGIVAFLFYLWFLKRASADRTCVTLVSWYTIYLVLISRVGSHVNKNLGEKNTDRWYGVVGVMLIVIQLCLYGFTDVKDVKSPELYSKIGLVYSILTIQWLLLWLFLAWSLWSLMTVITLTWSLLISASKWRIKRAVWTTQIANTCSGMLLGIATLCIWWTISIGSSNFTSQKMSIAEANAAVYGTPLSVGDSSSDDNSPLIIKPLKLLYDRWDSYQTNDENQAKNGEPKNGEPKNGEPKKSESKNVVESSTTFLNAISSAPMAFVLFSFSILAIVAAFSLRPAVSAEIPNDYVHPFRSKDDSEPNQTYCHQDGQTQGQSLSNGYKKIGDYARFWFLFSAIATFVAPIWVCFDTYYLPSVSQACIAVASLAFLAIVTKRTPYSQVLANVLDVASDVVNWLRLSPVRQNVTSKVYARYDAVLKHVSKQDYSHVVILAHSLGSLITVDLLRYWQYVAKGGAEQNGFRSPSVPELLITQDGTTQPSIHLVTFGCPLNQLLGLRFTTLYGWCRSEDDEPGTKPWLHNEKICDPKELQGISHWTNVYTAGDYVGRHVWHDNQAEFENKSNVWLPASDDRTEGVNENSDRKEFCLGAGAHVHYGEYNPPGVNNFREFVRELIANEVIADDQSENEKTAEGIDSEGQ